MTLPYPCPRLLFTVVAAVFGVSLFLSHWVLRWHPISIGDHFHFHSRDGRLHVACIAALGGAIASMSAMTNSRRNPPWRGR